MRCTAFFILLHFFSTTSTTTTTSASPPPTPLLLPADEPTSPPPGGDSYQSPHKDEDVTGSKTNSSSPSVVLGAEEGVRGYLDLEDESSAHPLRITFEDKSYTAEDLAEYIFWSGDERGVAIALNKLIHDGTLMSRDDAISFLESVDSHLAHIKAQYQLSSSSSNKQQNKLSPPALPPTTTTSRRRRRRT